MTTDERTEREKIIDKFLLLYVIRECDKLGVKLDEKSLMMLIYIIQATSEAQGVETFHYEWIWKEEE